MLEPEAFLEQLDKAIAQLQAIRDLVVASMPTPPATSGNGRDPDPGADFALHNLIDPASAQIRFAIPQDTLRKWARETAGTEQAVGRRGAVVSLDARRWRPQGQASAVCYGSRDATKLSGRAFRFVLARLAQRIAAAPHRLDVVAYSAFAYRVFRGRTPEQGWES